METFQYLTNTTDEFVANQAERQLTVSSNGYQNIILFTNNTISGVISLFGIAGNIINILIYKRLGFRETINISLLGLAVSDLLSLITTVWVSICWNPLMYYADLPFIPEDVDYLTGSLPHLLFTRVTAWITAFVATERCICIAFPLHVRSIVTPARVVAYIIATFVLVTLAQAASFYSSSLVWVFNSQRNRTVLTRVTREDSREMDNITYSINLVSPFGSFLIVVFCTTVTAILLKKKSKWRLTTANTQYQKRDNDADTTVKEKKVIKLVVAISAIFIVSYLPANVVHIFYCSISSQQDLVFQYWAYLGLAFSFIKVLEAINASVSLLLYYEMSSKFRSTVNEMFSIHSKQVASK